MITISMVLVGKIYTHQSESYHDDPKDETNDGIWSPRGLGYFSGLIRCIGDFQNGSIHDYAEESDRKLQIIAAPLTGTRGKQDGL